MQSGVREDRRVVRTREALFAAFERLLTEREYAEITVSLLAREADINRKTFYLHYDSIDDMVFDMMKRLAERMAEDVEDRLRARADNPPEDLIDFCVAAFFTEIHEWVKGREIVNRTRYLRVPTSRMIECFREPIMRIAVRAGIKQEGIPEWIIDANIAFVLGGMLGIYGIWLEEDQGIPYDGFLRTAALFTAGGVHRVREALSENQ